MKIQVKDLGAIKEAGIDLDKPLTLFCGENNTGKTYLAFIIYALTRMKISKSPFKINIPKLIEDGFIILKIDEIQLFKYKNNMIDEIKSNLNTIFGISEELAEQMLSDFQITFDSDLEKCKFKLKNLELNQNMSVNEHKFKIIKNKNELSLNIKIIEGIDYSSVLESEVFEFILSSIIANRLAFYPISNSVIFPVERNSIFTFSRELSLSRNILIEQMQKLSKGEKISPFDYLKNSSNRYPLAIRDGLNVSNDLQEIQKNKSDFFNIASEIEEKLLHGTLSVTKEGDVQFTTNKNKGKKLPIHMSASIVKTLSSLVFYLKYIAEKNDLIIIDEPEMNLHPDNQILLTKIFAKLLSNGFRLLISTHSDYIIREFNNIIMTSSGNQVVQKSAVKHNYDLNDAIKPENVGCYYFHYLKSSSRQVIVKEIQVDETGFEIRSIDNTIDSQNLIAEELFYSLKYPETNE